MHEAGLTPTLFSKATEQPLDYITETIKAGNYFKKLQTSLWATPPL